MEGKYRVKDGCLTVAMPKELDHHSALGLKAETDMLIGAYHVRRLVFDFSETEFMDSSWDRSDHRTLQKYELRRWKRGGGTFKCQNRKDISGIRIK